MEFLTPEEHAKLEQQIEHYKSKRKTISDRIGVARELGDLSENAEYHAAREDQGMNEAKIRQLEELFKNAKILDSSQIPEGMVFVGATVKLRDLTNNDEDLYRLVGQTTGSFSLDYIEVTQTSPMGEALMRARVGETVRVSLPKGDKRFEILEIVS